LDYSLKTLESEFTGQSLILFGEGEVKAMPILDPFSRVWTTHFGYQSIPFTKLTWFMEDLEGPVLDVYQGGDYLKFICDCPVPVMTQNPCANNMVEFPLTEVLKRTETIPHLQLGYFSDTLSYMLAYALYLNARSVSLYGFHYHAMDHRPIVATNMFWIGRLHERGIPVFVSEESNLFRSPFLDGLYRIVPGFYGYTKERFPNLGSEVKAVLDDRSIPGRNDMIERK